MNTWQESIAAEGCLLLSQGPSAPPHPSCCVPSTLCEHATYTDTEIHARTVIQRCADAHGCTEAWLRTCTNTLMCREAHTETYSYRGAQTHKYAEAHTETQVHTDAHTDAHIECAHTLSFEVLRHTENTSAHRGTHGNRCTQTDRCMHRCTHADTHR